MKKLTSIVVAMFLTVIFAAGPVCAQDDDRPAPRHMRHHFEDGKGGMHRGRHHMEKMDFSKLTQAQKTELFEMEKAHQNARLDKLQKFGVITPEQAVEMRAKAAEREKKMQQMRANKEKGVKPEGFEGRKFDKEKKPAKHHGGKKCNDMKGAPGDRIKPDMSKLTDAQKKELREIEKAHRNLRIDKLQQYGALTPDQAKEMKSKMAEREAKMKEKKTRGKNKK